MRSGKFLCILVSLLLSLQVTFQTGLFLSNKADARPITPPNQHRYSDQKMFESLGMMCKCCDGAGGECRAKWGDSPCSNLKCRPWKFL